MRWIREHKVLTAAIAILLGAVIIFSVSAAGGGLNGVTGAFGNLYSRVEKQMTAAGRAISENVSGIFSYRQLQKENEELKEEINELKEEMNRLALNEEELADLIRLFCGKDQDKAVNQILNIKGLMTIFEGMSPSDLKNLFDRAKVKSILAGQKDISISHLLFSVFELQDGEKTEDKYIIYLKSKGLTQRVINELTGISLRKIKSLTSNK